jgi:uncharacterized protein YjbJ (UPF0337 family)
MVFHTVAARIKRRGARFQAGGVATGVTGVNVASFKPVFDRRDTMKRSTKDQVEGAFHQVKGTIKEIAGKVSMNPDLEGEGKDEKIVGKVQEKIGEIEKVVGK